MVVLGDEPMVVPGGESGLAMARKMGCLSVRCAVLRWETALSLGYNECDGMRVEFRVLV